MMVLMKKTRKPKIFAFIDSQNLNLAIRDQGWKLDFARFRIYLKDKFKVEKAFLFIGYIPTNQKLYAFLKRIGYQLIFKPILELKQRGQVLVKGNVDAELVLHSMIEYPHYDKAIIISGDGDFYCLVNYLKKKKKLLRLIVPNKNQYSRLLRKFFKETVFLNKLKDKLSYKKQTTPR